MGVERGGGWQPGIPQRYSPAETLRLECSSFADPGVITLVGFVSRRAPACNRVLPATMAASSLHSRTIEVLEALGVPGLSQAWVEAVWQGGFIDVAGRLAVRAVDHTGAHRTCMDARLTLHIMPSIPTLVTPGGPDVPMETTSHLNTLIGLVGEWSATEGAGTEADEGERSHR